MAQKETVGEIIFKLYAALLFIMLVPLFIKNTYFASIVFLIAAAFPAIIYVIYRKNKKKNFFESRRTLEDLQRLTPNEFEVFIAHLFQKMGYRTEVVGGTSDGGIDVIAEKDGIKNYIQCKKFITQQVSVGAMRDFYGAVVNKLTNAKAYFITTNIFTLEAENFAEGKPIELIDGKKLMEYVRMSGIDVVIPGHPVSDSNAIEKCPWCGSQLILRTAQKGPNAGNNFYGCSNYPKCKFIKNISQS